MMAVALPVEVGQRLSMPERARRRSFFLVLGMSTRVYQIVCNGMGCIVYFCQREEIEKIMFNEK